MEINHLKEKIENIFGVIVTKTKIDSIFLRQVDLFFISSQKNKMSLNLHKIYQYLLEETPHKVNYEQESFDFKT